MFYVYCYFNPLKLSTFDECGLEPFYIGKGKNDRLIHHMFESNLATDSNRHKVNTIRKIQLANKKPYIKILTHYDIEEDALLEERRLIKLIGRRDLKTGPLTNMTDGGEGTTNKIFSAERRKKISESMKKAFAEGRASVSSAFKHSRIGKTDSEETKQKRALTRAGYSHSKDTRQKISSAHQLIRSTSEWKAKASAAQKGKKHTIAHVEKSIMGNPKSQPVHLLGSNYPSIGRAIKATGLTPGKVRKHPTFKLL